MDKIYGSSKARQFRLIVVIAVLMLSLLTAIAMGCSKPATLTRVLVGPVTAKIPATDSASASTAWATGEKTADGMLCWKFDGSGPITNIVDILKKQSYAIGTVSTVPFSHASPAGFTAHNISRNNYPEIANEIINKTKPDVVIGGGHIDFEAQKDGKPTTQWISNDDLKNLRDGKTPYKFVERKKGQDGNKAILDASLTVDITKGQKLFGLFGGKGGNFNPPIPKNTPGTFDGAKNFTINTENPSLASCSIAALNVLSKATKGFFLFIEQGDLDWANHANDFAWMIGATWDLDECVKAVEAYINKDGDNIDWNNTMVIVTSDHGNSYMRLKTKLNKGELPTQTSTVEGAVPGYGSGWKYDSSQVTYSCTDHTNELTSIYVKGGNGKDLFTAAEGKYYPGTRIVDNTQFFSIMKTWTSGTAPKNLIFIMGDGMQLEHEIAASRYIYGTDKGLSFHAWDYRTDQSTWDVTTYDRYAYAAKESAYTSLSAAKWSLGYDVSKGGKQAYPLVTSIVDEYFTKKLPRFGNLQ